MTIAGRALDTKGQPIADAMIYLNCKSPQKAIANTKTDSNGRYEFKDIAHNRLELFGIAKGFGFAWNPYISYNSSRGGFTVWDSHGQNPFKNQVSSVGEFGPNDKNEFDLNFGPPAKLRGRIVDGDGNPIPRTKIGLWNVEPTPAKGYDDKQWFLVCESSEFDTLYVDRIIPSELRNRWTDEEGYFEFEALPANCEFRIQATPPKGFARRMFFAATADNKLFRFDDLKIQETGMELKFIKNDLVPIQVVYDDTGLPAKNVYVSASNKELGYCSRVTDGFGVVELEIPSGDYRFVVLSEHKTPYISLRDREERIQLSSKLKRHVIRLKRAAEVEVEVIDELTGRPVEGFDVGLMDGGSTREYMWRSWKLPRTSMVERPKTGKNGKMMLYFKPGQYEIRLGNKKRPSGYQIKTKSQKIDCKPGKVQKLKFFVKGSKNFA